MLFGAEGARIVAGDIDGEQLDRLRERLEARGVEVVAVVGDVSKPEDEKRMMTAAVDGRGMFLSCSTRSKRW